MDRTENEFEKRDVSTGIPVNSPASQTMEELLQPERPQPESLEQHTSKSRKNASKRTGTKPSGPLPSVQDLDTLKSAELARAFEAGQVKRAATSIAITQNDDPWAADLDDRLGANDEAKAFARLAVAKDFTPPLAIGLFGNWGSGKSFFMRLIYQHIERLSEGKASPQAPEAGSKAFHTDVVQIRFNAWHYAETNLWASLVSHLFTELDRWYTKHNPQAPDPLLEHLSTSRMLTLDAAQELVRRRRDQRAASEQLLKARNELEVAQANTARSPSVYLAAVSKVLGANNDDKEIQDAKVELENAAKVLGIDVLAKGGKGFQDVSNALYDEAGKAKLLAAGYKNQLLNWWSVGIFALVILALPWIATEGMALLKRQLPFLENLHESLTLLSCVVVAVTTRLRWVWGKVHSALTHLEEGKEALDKVIRQRLAGQEKTLDEAQQHLARMNADVDEAKALVQATSEHLAHATHDFSQGTGAGRLKKFVRARATDGDYAQHLGLIATVRKDFEELAFNVAEGGSLRASVEAERAAFKAKMDKFLDDNKSLLDDEDRQKLNAAATHEPVEVQSFKRIALYIDDLDRCPPDKVVEVLQAVHLLLTFPLFVVLVAVDVRWVRKALLQHYPNLMTGAGEQLETASVSDYLEKIFQIPYWMRPMDIASSEQFLQSQLDRIKGSGSASIVLPTPGQSPVVVPERAEEVPTETLNITLAESEALQKLAPYIGSSPRRALRFLNVYRVIKASHKSEDLKALEESEYKALLTLLAISMATPRYFSNLLQNLMRRSDGIEMSEIGTLVNLQPTNVNVAEYDRFEAIVAVYVDLNLKEKSNPKHRVKKYAAIIQRYSFEG